MIKKFIQGFILGVVTTGAITIGAEIFAQINQEEPIADEELKVLLHKPVQCYPSDIVNQVMESRGFTVLWQGNNLVDDFPDNTIVILTSKTNAFMALEMNIEVACIIGYGAGFWFLDQYYSNNGDIS
jgi:hypothetical protein